MYIVNPDVGTGNIDAVKTAPVSTADRHVVRFTVGAGVDDEVEHGCVNEDDVVDGEILGLLDTQEAGAVALTVLVIFISETWEQDQYCHFGRCETFDSPCTAPLPVLLNISKSFALRMNSMFPASVPVR